MLLPYMYKREESVLTAHLPHTLSGRSSIIGQKARPDAYNRSVCSDLVRKGGRIIDESTNQKLTRVNPGTCQADSTGISWTI